MSSISISDDFRYFILFLILDILGDLALNNKDFREFLSKLLHSYDMFVKKLNSILYLYILCMIIIFAIKVCLFCSLMFLCLSFLLAF